MRTTGRLGCWLATRAAVVAFCDWTIMVRMELAARLVAERAGPPTEPDVYSDTWGDRLAAWGLTEDPLVPDYELQRAKAIAAGVSPCDLPRGR